VRENHREANQFEQRDEPKEVYGRAVLLKDPVQNAASIELIASIVSRRCKKLLLRSAGVQ
jgi:hypothetical protein